MSLLKNFAKGSKSRLFRIYISNASFDDTKFRFFQNSQPILGCELEAGQNSASKHFKGEREF
jgi:hypothetical protein